MADQKVAPPGGELLAGAVLDSLYKPIEALMTQIEELERGQQGWISTLTTEQQNLINTDNEFAELMALFAQISPYLNKLSTMKKDMKDIQERVKKMHATALKIREKKVRDEEQRAEKDRQILAQPAPSLLEEQAKSNADPVSAASPSQTK